MEQQEVSIYYSGDDVVLQLDTDAALLMRAAQARELAIALMAAADEVDPNGGGY